MVSLEWDWDTLTRIREKTGLRRRAELTRWAMEHALSPAAPKPTTTVGSATWFAKAARNGGPQSGSDSSQADHPQNEAENAARVGTNRASFAQADARACLSERVPTRTKL
jgi:hypothetical protein